MIVLDSSVVIARLTPDRRADFVRALLEPKVGTFNAPQLLAFEVIHVLSRKYRQGDITGAELSRALEGFEDHLIELAPRPDAGALHRIAMLADAQKLSGYDASYLELALRLGAELATLDADLAEAGRRCGVAVHHTP